MISVIVPVYNTKQYLRKCVESLLEGTAVHCEILLVDDGSTDQESGALCDCLATEHPSIVRVIHQKNTGAGGARNTGIREAKGEYILFVDSDDTVVHGTLNKLQSFICRYPRAEIISFGFLIADEFGIHPWENTYPFTAEGPFSLAERPEFLLLVPSVCCRIWRRTLFAENHICFPDRVLYGEDLRTAVKLFPLAKEIVWIPDELYVYYQRTGSAMHSANLERNRDMIEAFDDVLTWYRDRGLFEYYEKTLMRLCAEHLYLAASVRILQEDSTHPLLKELAEYMDTQFPNHRKADLRDLPKARRLVYKLLNLRQYKLIALLFKIRERSRTKS